MSGTENPTYGFGLLQSLDKFGLPSNLDLLSDSEQIALDAVVINRIREMFAAAVKYLGEERARDDG